MDVRPRTYCDLFIVIRLADCPASAFIPEGAGSCQGWRELGLCGLGGLCWAWVTGVSRSPIGADVRGARESDDVAAEREPGGRAGYLVVQVRPIFRVIRCGQCRWLHSSLRVSPAVAGDAWGGSASEGQAGPIRLTPRRAGAGGRIACGLAPGGGQNAWRPRAWPSARGWLVMLPGPSGERAVPGGAGTGSGSARRASRRRPGSAACGRLRPSRCSSLPSRAGR